jgi:glucokinase
MIFGGIDIGGTSVKVGFVDNNGKILCSDLFHVEKIKDYTNFLKTLHNSIISLIGHLDNNIIIQGYGVGCPGRINYQEGKVIWCRGKLEYIENKPLGPDLSALLNKPVVCDNDVNSIVLGEALFGKGKNLDIVIGLTFGTGVGGGIVINGDIIRGEHFTAGHFGYMSQDSTGRKHESGNSGAVEIHASHSGVMYKIREAMRLDIKTTLKEKLNENDFGFKHIYEESARGDEFSIRLVKDLENEMSILITNLVFAFDPSIILVGGGLLKAEKSILSRVRKKIKKRISFLESKEIIIEPMSSYDKVGILGGAALAKRELK